MRAIACAVVLVLATSSAAAQPAGAQAEVLFRQGRDLMAAGKFAEACASFEQSQKLDPATSTLINLAACREKLGQLATAWGLFLDAERQTRAAKDDATTQLHDIARTKAKKLEPRVSKLTINIATKVDGLEVTRNKERVEAIMWNRALPVDGGTYTIVAHAPGMVDWSVDVKVANEGETKVVDVPALKKPEPKPEPPKPKPEPPKPKPEPPKPIAIAKQHDEPTSSRGVLPFVVGGAGVVLIGGAIGMSLWGDSTYNAAKAEMTSQARRDSLYDSANHKRYAAEGFAIGGIACAGVAVWLYLRDREHPAPLARGAHVIVSPTGVGLVGAF